MDILFWVVILAISLAVLVKAADIFTEYAEKLGQLLKMSPFIIGGVIVAIGTSLPEFATSIFAAIQNAPEAVAGNVIGTVIVNLLLGFGLAAVLTKKPIKFTTDITQGELPIMIAATILVVFTLRDGHLSIAETSFFFVGLLMYFMYARTIHRESKSSAEEVIDKVQERSKARIISMVIFSLVVIFLSAKYAMDSVIALATMLDIGTSVLAASIVAVGTSLPEITVAIVAARKRKYDLLLGNIFGSNLFDILSIFGIAGFVNTLVLDEKMLTLGLPMLIAVTVLSWVILTDKKITRSEGLFMLLVYGLFVGKLFDFI